MSHPFEIITVFAIYSTVDEYGRRGGIEAVTESKTNAKTLAKGKGWYGSDGAISEKKAIRVGDGVILLDSPTEYPLDVDLPKLVKEQKAAALAKLTDHEATLLGLKK